LKAAKRFALVVAVALGGCTAPPLQDDVARIALLKASYENLHARLEKAAAHEPLVAAAVGSRGEVVLGIRAGLIEELAGNVARRYLDRVTVDLSGIEARKTGQIRKKTFLGRFKLGEWSVSVDLDDLVGDLRAGSPRLSLRAPDLIDVELPVDVQETEGLATIRFGWDSSGLANVVCKDFDLTREIRGRVLAQHHVLSGALRFLNTGEALTLTPVFPDRVVQLKIDLVPSSWGVVEAALRSQDTFAKCGLVMDPDKGLVKLHALAARGIKVHLPDSIFRAVDLPARLQQSVHVGQRSVGLKLKAESLRIENANLWSSVSVEVQTAPKP
jgi:hypothetical protein